MIFVTVGSSANGFDRIIRIVDELKTEGKIKEEVVMQIGNGSYIPKSCKFFRFNKIEDIEKLNKNARVVITHAGAGSIITALKYKTPVIIVPRLKDLGEHTDNHQLEIAKTLEKEGKVLVATEKNSLLKQLKRIHKIKITTRKGWLNIRKEIEKFL